MKTINFFLKNIKLLIYLFVILFSSILIILESNSQLGASRLTTDFVSWGISSIAPMFGIGYPYVDYWGINPPGLLMFTAFWGFLAGPSLKSFHILYIILLSCITYLTWKIINRFFNLAESLILFFIFSIIFFSSTVQSQFFPSEINGLFFALLGLYLILKNKVSKKEIFWASFAFILAGQMKEVFAFTGIVIFPHLLKAIHLGKKEVKNILFYSFLGILASFIVILAYLKISHSVGEYKDILDYKSQQFSLNDSEKLGGNLFRGIQFPKERFIYTKYQVPSLMFFSFCSFLVYLSLAIKSKKDLKNSKTHLSLSLSFPKKSMSYAILLFFWIGSTIGYIAQGRYGNKYEIQALLPMILIVAFSVKIILKSVLKFFEINLSEKFTTSIIIPLLIAILLPKKLFFVEPYHDFLNYSPNLHINKWFKLENSEDLALENYIKENTNKSDCITAVYGWGIGSHYYYSQRASCSKYFLVNILPKERYQEYQNELLENPPKAIVYIEGGADLNIAQFESNAFDFGKVIKNCYKQDGKFSNLYWSNFNKKEQSKCLLLGIPTKVN